MSHVATTSVSCFRVLNPCRNGRDGAVALLDQVPRKVEKIVCCLCVGAQMCLGKKIVPRRYRKKCSYICRSMCFRPLRAGYIPNSQAQAGKFDALITELLLRAVSRFIAITAGCIPIHKRDARLTSPRWRACGHWGHQALNAYKDPIVVTSLLVPHPEPFTVPFTRH